MVQAQPVTAALRPPEHRVERVCSICGQMDDHPHIIAMLPDGSVVDAHHDCAAGHPDSHPDVVRAAQATIDAAGGKHGAELSAHLTRNVVEADKAHAKAAKAAQSAEGN